MLNILYFQWVIIKTTTFIFHREGLASKFIITQIPTKGKGLAKDILVICKHTLTPIDAIGIYRLGSEFGIIHTSATEYGTRLVPHG